MDSERTYARTPPCPVPRAGCEALVGDVCDSLVSRDLCFITGHGLMCLVGEEKLKFTAPGIPRRSPIQVLTGLDVA